MTTDNEIDETLKLLAKRFIDKGYDGGLNEGDVPYPEFHKYQEIAEAKAALNSLLEREKRMAETAGRLDEIDRAVAEMVITDKAIHVKERTKLLTNRLQALQDTNQEKL